MCGSNQYLYNKRPHLNLCVGIFFFLTLIYSSHSLFQLTNSWESFQYAHILNPGEQLNSDFGHWTTKDWKAWYSYRMTLLNRTRATRQKRVNSVRHRHSLKDRVKPKPVDVVTIANATEVLNAFTGTLVPYGTHNQAAFWSNKPFTTYVIQRAGKSFRVYYCGKTFIAARMYDGKPEHLQDYYPFIIRNPLGGNLRYDLSRKCKPVPKDIFISLHTKVRESRRINKY